MMDTGSLQEEESPTFENLLAQIGENYEHTQKELKEIEVLIRQSSAEVEKLAQRNAQLATKLSQMEANLDTVPRQDIKEIYSHEQETDTSTKANLIEGRRRGEKNYLNCHTQKRRRLQ